MTRQIKYLLLGLILAFSCSSFGQQSTIDSLKLLLKTAKEDTNKVNTLNRLGKLIYPTGEVGVAKKYADEANTLATKIGFQKGVATSYLIIGVTYHFQANYPEALKNYLASLKINEQIGDKKGVTSVNNNIGGLYQEQGNFKEALKYLFAALKMQEEIGNIKGSASAYMNIGNIYFHQENYPEALKYYYTGLKKAEETDYKTIIASSHNMIGSTLEKQGDYSKALESFRNCLEISQEINNQILIGGSYGGIGAIHIHQNNLTEALENYLKALNIFKTNIYKSGVSTTYMNIGTVYLKLNNSLIAKKYLDSALVLSRELGINENIKESYRYLSVVDSAIGDYKAAYENHKMFIIYRDSLINQENTKKTVQTQMQYEFDKKESLAKAEQDKKDAITAEEKQRQKVITYSIGTGLFLVLLLSFFIFRGYRQKQRANKELEQKNILIEKSKHIIEEKNKDITDSINYAKRIQKAMLPHRKDIWTAFPQSFVLFKPKDIVSGDFYFFHTDSKSTIIASADCTGHGVPGAFMSMVGAGKLNDAVAKSTDTSEILSLLNKGVKSALKQSETDESATRDGMDIALCSVDTNARIVKYAGANRPIWIIRNGQTAVEEIKATKKAIGGFTEDSQHFDSHEIQFEKGDTFYISTDGFADTFGGQDAKKVTTKRFKEILVSIQDKTMKEQEQHLDSFIENWKGGTEQIDDILVIGVRL